MFDLTFLEILARTISAVVVLSALGLFLAVFARLLGDMGPTYDGKATLNPFRHIDFFAFVGVIAAQIGWVRPAVIDPAKSRFGRLAPVIAGVLALAAVLILGRVIQLALPLVAIYWPQTSAPFVASVIRAIGNTAAWTVAFNLVPVPPLVGGYLLQAISPPLHGLLARYAFWISLALGAIMVLTYGRGISMVFGTLARMLGAR